RHHRTPDRDRSLDRRRTAGQRRTLMARMAGIRTHSASPRGQRGFTLIEVIVALAVFALGATVLAAAYVNVLNAIDSVKSDQALEQEIVLVRSQVLQETDRDKVEEGGDLPTAQLGEATWRAVVTPSE